MKIILDEISKRYDGLADSCCSLSCGRAIDFAKPKPGDVCLDLGSGRGADVIHLAEQVGETGYVFGIDASPSMIETARKNAEKFGFGDNVEFIQSELIRLPLPDNSINHIISNCTLNHVTNKQLIWHEIYRVLFQNGHFTISDIYAIEPVPDEYKNDPVAIAECWAGAVTKYEYLKHLTVAGFNNIKILEESKPYAKGNIMVVGITITGSKSDTVGGCGCGCTCH